jgi:hypothetical protein
MTRLVDVICFVRQLLHVTIQESPRLLVTDSSALFALTP